MPVLFTISVLCLCAVLWSAVSIARHVMATRRRRRPTSRREGFAEIFFEDKMQQIRDHAIAARQAAAAGPKPIQWAPPVTREPLRPPVMPQPVPTAVDLAPRKAPQPAAQGGSYRADWDYFNKDLGDLTDPYETTPREPAATRIGARH